jgi:DNA repair exonuclease SbcCD ATPase subunit
VKIAKLYVRHVKGIREVEIHAHPTVNEVAGPNGAGKSSVLDSIVFALAGKRSIDPRALREGEAKGEITVELEDLVVTRRFKEGSSPTLTVKPKNGDGRLGQRDLDQLWGTFTFDPLAFSRMRPAEQVEVLRQLAGEEYVQALEAKDAELAEATENRTVVNRQLQSFGRLEPVEEVEEVEVAAVAQELREAEEFNRHQQATKVARESRERQIEDNRRRMVGLREELEALDKQTEALSSALAADGIADPIVFVDTARLHDKLADAARTNHQAEGFRRYREQLERQQELARQSEDLDRIVSKLREDRAELARAAQLPVDGLSFSDSGVRVGALPFEQLSASEQIRVSARIGMASSAELKVMLVKDGSLLDEKSWKELTGVAEGHGYQLWVETVGEGHGDAVVLEEGAVRERF